MDESEEATWGRSTVDTACPLDCPDTCSLAVSVEEGRIAKIDGSARNSITNGYICSKVRRFDQRVYGIDRLHHPGVRNGAKGDGRFRKISWTQALETIAKKFQRIREEFGAESILPVSYGGSNGLVTQDTADAEFFRQIGSSRLARTVCAAPTTTANTALYGKMPGVGYKDYEHAKLIVVWGANPSTTGIHLVPHIRKALSSGAKLVVIDPRQTSLAKRADIHLAVRPGTDVAVALAIHKFLFDHSLLDSVFLEEHATGVNELRSRASEWSMERAASIAEIDVRQLEQFAELYAGTSPAVIRCGWGLERNRNGGNAAMAVLALPTIAGKFQVRGGGFSMSNSGALGLSNSSWISAPEPNTRVVNMNQLGRSLSDCENPPIKALFVYNCNPVVTLPHQNLLLQELKRDDLFVVVFDQVMTDTAKWADVVLPATTFLEQYDVARSYGLGTLELVQPVIEAVGEARPNVEIFAELSRLLDVDCPPALLSDPEALMHVVGSVGAPLKDQLLSKGHAEPEWGLAPVQFVDVFPRTTDRKVNLFPQALELEAPHGLYRFQPEVKDSDYPLVLVSPATDKTITSTLGELRPRLASLQIHPDDAEARDLATGDTARMFNAIGEVHCPIQINPGMKPGVVSLPKGLWQKSTMNGSTANALVPDSLTDLGGGACFNDTRVQITRIVTANIGGQSIAIWPSSTPTKEVN